MPFRSVFVGIDVACAKGKKLPICVVAADNGKIIPQIIPDDLFRMLPKGLGNREISSDAPFVQAAREVSGSLKEIALKQRWTIERIAIDAPARPPRSGVRASEKALNKKGLSCFMTPCEEDWEKIREQCQRHRGTLARMPHSNKIWMLFGFELFKSFKSAFNCEVFEVFPYAIISELLPRVESKRTDEGYRKQLSIVAKQTGWEEPDDLCRILKASVHGRRDDRLDAFMSAWVATICQNQRGFFGDPKVDDDVIWNIKLTW